MSFYLPQVQISCWKTKMPSLKNSQTCLRVYLIHGIPSASSFPIPCLENCCYGSANTEHMDPQNEPLVHTTWMDEASERRSRSAKEEEDRARIGTEGKDTKKASSQKTSTSGLLGPVRAWTSSQLGVLERSTTLGQPGWLADDSEADEIQELHVL